MDAMEHRHAMGEHMELVYPTKTSAILTATEARSVLTIPAPHVRVQPEKYKIARQPMDALENKPVAGEYMDNVLQLRISVILTVTEPRSALTLLAPTAIA